MSTANKFRWTPDSVLSLILFWFGAGTLFSALVIGLQVAGATKRSGLPSSMALIPPWGIVALVLAFALRNSAASTFMKAAGVAWLALGLCAAMSPYVA